MTHQPDLSTILHNAYNLFCGNRLSPRDAIQKVTEEIEVLLAQQRQEILEEAAKVAEETEGDFEEGSKIAESIRNLLTQGEEWKG